MSDAATADKPKKKSKNGDRRHNRRQLTGGDLTPQEEAFTLHYLKHFKQGQAAKDAGIPPERANQFAWKTLQKPQVQARLERYRQMLIERTEISAERIIQELGLQAFFDPRAFYETKYSGKGADRTAITRARHPSELTPEQARMIKQMRIRDDGKVEYIFVDRQYAIDRLARNLGVISNGAAGNMPPGLPALPTAPMSTLPFDLKLLSDETLKMFVDVYMLAKREAERAVIEAQPLEDLPDD